MPTIPELFEALNTKAAPVPTADLAKDLQASREGILKQLSREKDKGNVSGNSQDGWEITDEGRKALETGEFHPTMIDEEVTPRQQFEAIGRRIGIKDDRIVLATDIVWSGEYNDVKWAWDALGQADIADDLRSVWVNAWRAKLHKSIPPDLETELTGVSKAVEELEESGAPSKNGGRDYVIHDDEPVRVGVNLGDYSLQDAKDILAIRALRGRFSGTRQAGTGLGGTDGAGATGEKISDLLTALHPYLNKGSDIETLKEVLGDKLALQRQEILNQMPHPVQPTQPKPFIEQISEFVALLGSLKEAGPVIRSIMGVPESSGNRVPTDLDQEISWRTFLGSERRADERQTEIAKTLKVARENVPDGIQAVLQAVTELKGLGTGAKTPAPAEAPAHNQVFACGVCKTAFSAPADWADQPLKCPNPECGREYTKEELLG